MLPEEWKENFTICYKLQGWHHKIELGGRLEFMDTKLEIYRTLKIKKVVVGRVRPQPHTASGALPELLFYAKRNNGVKRSRNHVRDDTQ